MRYWLVCFCWLPNLVKVPAKRVTSGSCEIWRGENNSGLGRSPTWAGTWIGWQRVHGLIQLWMRPWCPSIHVPQRPSVKTGFPGNWVKNAAPYSVIYRSRNNSVFYFPANKCLSLIAFVIWLHHDIALRTHITFPKKFIKKQNNYKLITQKKQT